VRDGEGVGEYGAEQIVEAKDELCTIFRRAIPG